MVKLDILISGGTVVNSTESRKIDLGIKNGKIFLHCDNSEKIFTKKLIDAKDKIIVPGLVDSHVHFREPGYTHKEDLNTGTMAAAVGGVTTAMDMPNTEPPVLTPNIFEEKLRLAEGRIFVDLAIQAGVGANLNEIDNLTDLGAISFEIFLAELPPPFLIDQNFLLINTLEKIMRAGSIAGITAGDDGVVSDRIRKIKKRNKKNPILFARSRPPIAEAFGVGRGCLAAEEVGGRVHFRQISCAKSLQLLRQAKFNCKTITAEVTPHNLSLTEQELKNQGPYAKMIPPLRKSDDLEALWKGIEDGTIDIIATDHAPHLESEKRVGESDIFLAPGGISGVQTFFLVMFDQILKREMTINDLVRLCSERPAKIFDIYPKKGCLNIGSDADLIIIDPKKDFIIKNKDQLSKAGRTPFNGWKVRGCPILTMVRGNIVMENGKLEGNPIGEIIRPI